MPLWSRGVPSFPPRQFPRDAPACAHHLRGLGEEGTGPAARRTRLRSEPGRSGRLALGCL